MFYYASAIHQGWLGSKVVSVFDSRAVGPVFKSQPRRCQVTVLGKLFTPVVPLFTKQQNWYWPTGWKDNCGLSEQKVMAAYCRVYDSRHLQAGSVPGPCARQSSMGYLYLFTCHPIDGSEALCFGVVHLCVRACVPTCRRRLVDWLFGW